MMSADIKPGYVLVEVIAGAEGPSLYIGDGCIAERIAGPKPWGGGRSVHTFQVKAEDIHRVVDAYKDQDDEQQP